MITRSCGDLRSVSDFVRYAIRKQNRAALTQCGIESTRPVASRAPNLSDPWGSFDGGGSYLGILPSWPGAAVVSAVCVRECPCRRWSSCAS